MEVIGRTLTKLLIPQLIVSLSQMELVMIKPFKVTKTVVEPEGNVGVHFISTKSIVRKTLGGAMSVKRIYLFRPDADID